MGEANLEVCRDVLFGVGGDARVSRDIEHMRRKADPLSAITGLTRSRSRSPRGSEREHRDFALDKFVHYIHEALHSCTSADLKTRFVELAPWELVVSLASAHRFQARFEHRGDGTPVFGVAYGVERLQDLTKELKDVNPRFLDIMRRDFFGFISGFLWMDLTPDQAGDVLSDVAFVPTAVGEDPGAWVPEAAAHDPVSIAAAKALRKLASSCSKPRLQSLPQSFRQQLEDRLLHSS